MRLHGECSVHDSWSCAVHNLHNCLSPGVGRLLGLCAPCKASAPSSGIASGMPAGG